MYLSYSVEDGGVVDTVHVTLIQRGRSSIMTTVYTQYPLH